MIEIINIKNINLRKNAILFSIVLMEIIVGSIFLFNFYQREIVNKTSNKDKITVIKKDNLIFPKNSEFRYYFELEPSVVVTSKPDWLGYEANYNYNADGINDRFDYTIEKPADTFRIVALGDSFTYGQFVNTKDNWTEQLEDLLNKFNKSVSFSCGIKKFEIINLGMPGFDVSYITKRYQDIGAKYKPDLIIWFEGTSGFERLNEIVMPTIEDCEKKEVNSSILAKDFYYCWKKANEKIKAEYSPAEVNKMITDRLDSFFASLNKEKVLFFTYEDSNLTSNSKKILNQWRERYPSVVFSSTIPGSARSQQILSDGHPSVKGHETMAISIYNYLDNYLKGQCNVF
jgi:lysophospholipase L1-like esterase